MNWFKLKKKNNKAEHNKQKNGNLNKSYELNNLKEEIKQSISKLKYDSDGIFLLNFDDNLYNPYIEINKLYLFAVLSKAFIINDTHANYEYVTNYKYGELFYKFDDDRCKSIIKKFNKEDLYVPDLKGVKIYNYDDFVKIIIDRANKQYKDINTFVNNIFSEYNDEEYLKQVLLKVKVDLKAIKQTCDQIMNIYSILKGYNDKFRNIYYKDNKNEINSLVASLYKANDKLFNLIEKYNINFIELKEAKKNKKKKALYNNKLNYLKNNALNTKKINDISKLIDQL